MWNVEMNELGVRSVELLFAAALPQRNIALRLRLRFNYKAPARYL